MKTTETTVTIPLDITKEMQHAFARAAEKIIFNNPPQLTLCHENVRTISRHIQQEFIEVYDNKRYELFYGGGRFGSLMWKDKEGNQVKILGGTTASPEEKRWSNFHNDTPWEYLTHLKARLYVDNYSDDTMESQLYGAGAFTPKLAALSEAELGGMNCFGMAIFVGAMCNKGGITPLMGIGPDHPVIFLDVADDTYVFDMYRINNNLLKAEGEVFVGNDYHIYYPCNKKENRITKMIFAHDFDHAVLFEMLENFQALKQAVQGEENVLLPFSREEILAVAKEHEEVLLAGDWKGMQKVLFPTIHDAFHIHDERWQKEIRRVSRVRNKWYWEQEVNERLLKLLTNAKEKAGWVSLENKEVMSKLKTLPVDIIREAKRYLVGNVELSLSVNEEHRDVFLFFTSLKEGIIAQDNKLKQLLWRRVKQKFLTERKTSDNLS